MPSAVVVLVVVPGDGLLGFVEGVDHVGLDAVAGGGFHPVTRIAQGVFFLVDGVVAKWGGYLPFIRALRMSFKQ